jgi:hypothetical protein
MFEIKKSMALKLTIVLLSVLYSNVRFGVTAKHGDIITLQ